MFTGIVTALGTISQVEQRGDLRLRIAAPLDPARIDMGASIASDGVCLTVVDLGPNWYEVQISAEDLGQQADTLQSKAGQFIADVKRSSRQMSGKATAD